MSSCTFLYKALGWWYILVMVCQFRIFAFMRIKLLGKVLPDISGRSMAACVQTICGVPASKRTPRMSFVMKRKDIKVVSQQFWNSSRLTPYTGCYFEVLSFQLSFCWATFIIYSSVLDNRLEFWGLVYLLPTWRWGPTATLSKYVSSIQLISNGSKRMFRLHG